MYRSLPVSLIFEKGRNGVLGDSFSVECLLVCPGMVFYGLLVVAESGADLSEHSTGDEGYNVLCESCGLPSAHGTSSLA
jgi:hypothetical protein